MLYKYHVAIVKDQVIVADRYYKKEQQPDNDEFKKLQQQFGADEIFLNTVDDTDLELFIKEKIDLENI